ncbi:MAG: cell division protein DivIVA, partial [Polyangiaceae bacterium]|nr:cell division protein DivIVA [Polyangiaceae bacterium]
MGSQTPEPLLAANYPPGGYGPPPGGGGYGPPPGGGGYGPPPGA